MTKTTVLCNMCGKEMTFVDIKCQGFTMKHHYGYGSAHDEDKLELDLCCECLDKLTTYLINTCKINPVTEYDFDDEL